MVGKPLYSRAAAKAAACTARDERERESKTSPFCTVNADKFSARFSDPQI